MIKPCPFCGHELDIENGDTLYPSGIGYKIRDNGKISYHSYREVPPENWCYKIVCNTTEGGCGAEISDNSRKECIDKWNTRM
jgi:hypothetical protein